MATHYTAALEVETAVPETSVPKTGRLVPDEDVGESPRVAQVVPNTKDSPPAPTTPIVRVCPECAHTDQRALAVACCEEIGTATAVMFDCVPRSLAKLTGTQLVDVQGEDRPDNWYLGDVFWPRFYRTLVHARRVDRGDCRAAIAVLGTFAGLMLSIAAIVKC